MYTIILLHALLILVHNKITNNNAAARYHSALSTLGSTLAQYFPAGFPRRRWQLAQHREPRTRKIHYLYFMQVSFMIPNTVTTSSSTMKPVNQPITLSCKQRQRQSKPAFLYCLYCLSMGNLFLLLLLLLNSLSPCSLALAMATSSAASTTKSAVIVGGGPVGLATALTLSNPPHCYDVVVLEQASVEQYDPTKAYLYNVNFRGQTWMKEHFPSVLQKLRTRGSSGSMSRISIVPADPEKPIPGQKTLQRYDVNKENNESNNKNGFMTEEKAQNDDSDGDINLRSYWIPRHSMICLLEDEIQEQEQRRKTMSDTRYQIQFGEIQLKKGRQFTEMKEKDDGTIEVSVKGENGTTETYSGNLIVAADGYNSAVWLLTRRCSIDSDFCDETAPLPSYSQISIYFI